jgi:hypothetical protein
MENSYLAFLVPVEVTDTKFNRIMNAKNFYSNHVKKNPDRNAEPVQILHCACF